MINHQLELSRLHDRQILWPCAFENPSRIIADLTIGITQAGTVAHQPADIGKIAQRISCGYSVERGPLDHLDASDEQKGSGRDEQDILPLARDAFERGLYLAACIGIEDLNLQSYRATSRFRVPQRGLSHARIGRIDEHRDATCTRNQFTEQFQPLCSQLDPEKADPREVATRPG